MSYGSYGQQPPQQPAPWGPQPGHRAGFPPVGDPGTLDLPYYGISFGSAIKRAFGKYARFDGRASRSEYWWYALFNAIVFVVLYALAMILGFATGGSLESDEPGPGFYPFAILIMVFMLGSIVPGISITVRRLHDQDLSGWLVLLSLIPSVGSLIITIFAIMDSKPSGARFDRVRSSYPPVAG